MSCKTCLIFAMLALVLASCGGQARASSIGDPEAGKALFQQASIREAPACSTCHSLEPGKVIVGPSLAGIALYAEERMPGMPAVAYLRQSILEPNAYVVEGFSEGVMYQDFRDVLSEEDVEDLVAYLLTLE